MSQVSDYSRILVLPTSENIVTHMQAATQLLSAAQNGDLANVRRLLTEGHVDVNVTDKVGVHVIGLSYSSAAIEHRRDNNVAERWSTDQR